MNAFGLVTERSRPTLGLFFLGQVTVVLRLLAGTESRFQFRLFHPPTLRAEGPGGVRRDWKMQSISN